MIEIGRLCVKIAGRDAGKKGVIVDILDDKYVLIDGETRRRKVNIQHIEPLNQVIKIGKNASHEEVAKALDELGIKARVTKPKPATQKPKAKRKTEKPRKKRKTPEQLRVQKEEKKKFRDIFKPKKKEEKEEKKEVTLEEKAGLAEEGKEEEQTNTTEIKSAKEIKPKEKKAAKKKE